MRAMPSPTSSTRPTSRASSLERYWLISVCRTETISSALNLMTASRYDLVPDSFQLGADRGVVQPIADPHDHPAEQLGIDLHRQDRFQPERIVQFALEALALVVGQGDCGADLH